MNPGYRLLLAGAEAAERAAGPERGAFVYRTVAEQTNGEGRDAAIVGFLRCAIASENPKLIEQAIESWSLVDADVFDELHAFVVRLYAKGNGRSAMALLRKEYDRKESTRGAFLFALGLQGVEHDARRAAHVFREVEAKAPEAGLRSAALIRRIRAEVTSPRKRRSALQEAKKLESREALPCDQRRLLAEVDLYASSRFRRAAALQQLSELATREGAEQTSAKRAVRCFLECAGDSLTALEQDRVDALFAALKRSGSGGLGASTGIRVEPSAALRTRALEVSAGSPPWPKPVDSSTTAWVLEFVAEAALPNGTPAPNSKELLRRLASGDPIDVDYSFRCLDVIWRKRNLASEALERSVLLARAVLALPGFPKVGFMALLSAHTPSALHLDIAFAAMAADERGAELALIRAASTSAAAAGGEGGDLEATFRLLRELKVLVGTESEPC